MPFAFTCMYFIHICIFGHVNAQQIYTPVCKCKFSFYFKKKIGIKNKIFLCLHQSKNTLIIHILDKHSTKNQVSRKLFFFYKMLIFSYNNAQIHPNVTVQYLKSITFVQKA